MKVIIDGKTVRLRMTIEDVNVLRDALTRLILRSADNQKVIELLIEGDSVTVDTEVKRL